MEEAVVVVAAVAVAPPLPEEDPGPRGPPGAQGKRQAWAHSRDSWQASEEAALHPRELAGKLRLAAETAAAGHVPNEKIATWLKDCRTPLGASLDEQSNPKGMLLKNGGSFEDDLSLGAEADHLNHNIPQMDSACNGMLAEDRRRQFSQKGRSMNSTGSGKSSATVSSVSELLDLYEEDPEEILYNLGFGTDEPDIAAKIPPRFFNGGSFARGIDIKVFLSAQMQRMEVENPNFALTRNSCFSASHVHLGSFQENTKRKKNNIVYTISVADSTIRHTTKWLQPGKKSRFRQIEVLTTVANAFSYLYSQVSGTPVQKIGSSASLATNKDTTAPAPLARTPTASRLLKTLSRHNLLGGLQIGEITNAVTSPVTENDDSMNSDQKLLKTMKKRDTPLLATVKEEAGHIPIMGDLNVSSPTQGTDTTTDRLTTDMDMPSAVSPTDAKHCGDSSTGHSSSFNLSLQASSEKDPEGKTESPQTSTPEKEPCVPLMNPSLVQLMTQQRQDSYEMEEIQSTEGELTQGPSVCQLSRDKLAKDYFSGTRTASQHSDSSGFAEDPSSDYVSAVQAHELIKDMGSSADSCDSENTVTSNGDELMTPTARDRPDFKEYEEEEFLTPCETSSQKRTFFPGSLSDLNSYEPVSPSDDAENKPIGSSVDTENKPTDAPEHAENKPIGTLEVVEQQDSGEVAGLDETKDESLDDDLSEVQQEGADESDVDNLSFEIAAYSTHHISETTDCSDYRGGIEPALDTVESSPLERVTVALQRAQMKVGSTSELSGSRVGRSMITAKDLLRRRTQFAESGYPLRRTQSLPTALLSPVRVVSSVSVRVSSGKATVCTPPSFTYKYTPEEEDVEEEEKPNVDLVKESQSASESRRLVSPPVKKENQNSGEGINQFMEDQLVNRSQTYPVHEQSTRSHSSCSLHSVHSDWQERPLCDHARAWSTQSVPGIFGASCNALSSPFGCHYSQRLSGHPRPCSGHVSMNPPSAIEMQLRRVLHDIRNSLQNLNQYPMMRGNEIANNSFTQRPSILPLYENTFHELQVMRQSLNLFRTQMMDLELSMLRQQTMVYHQLTEEEKYEADQLQGLRNNVRMELQELEMQLEERLLFLEEQLRTLHMSSPYRPQPLMGMYGSRSTDNLSYTSPLSVMEPVTQLMREQSYLKSELGLGEVETGAERAESVWSHVASDAGSVCSNSSQRSRRSRLHSSDHIGRSKPTSPQNKPTFRASVALTPAPPVRAGIVQPPTAVQCVEELNSSTLEADRRPFSPASEGSGRSAAENEELQKVIREIKESIVGDIRREIVSGLLAAVSSSTRSTDGKQDGKF